MVPLSTAAAIISESSDFTLHLRVEDWGAFADQRGKAAAKFDKRG
jgi:hypothetical protein